MADLLVTGANGHLGRRLIRTLPAGSGVQALVRSEDRRNRLLRSVGARDGLEVTVGNPRDPGVVQKLALRCDAAVHLIGTIKAGRDNPLEDSHQRAMAALLEGIAGTPVTSLVYLSILGAAPHSHSACLAARAAVERMAHDAPVAARVIRVPMVLGEGDRASGALARRVRHGRATLFRAASLEQPIYAGDVIAAIGGALSIEGNESMTWDLAGPESLSRRALVVRAAAAAHRSVKVRSLPLWLGLLFAGVLETFKPDPPVTRDMLRILDHDDAIDPIPAARALGVELTTLDEMLSRTVAARLDKR